MALESYLMQLANSKHNTLQLSLADKALLRDKLVQALPIRPAPYALDEITETTDSWTRAAITRGVAEYQAECAAVLKSFPALAFLEPDCLHACWDDFCADVYFSHWTDPFPTNRFPLYLLGALAAVRDSGERPACCSVPQQVEYGIRLWHMLTEGYSVSAALLALPTAQPLSSECEGDLIDTAPLFS